MSAAKEDRMMKFFNFKHITHSPSRSVSSLFQCLASQLVATVPAGPERTVALRKLLEAKDCAVRAVIFESEVS